jgi:hypothetical protein
MRRVFSSCVRGAAAVAVIAALSTSAMAAPREDVDRERGRSNPIVKVVKRIIQALGDGLTIPRP